MKRCFYSLFILVVFLPSFLSSQTITGKLVDQNGNGLPGLTLQLYISPQVYNTTSSSDGSFTFNNVTEVKDEQLPTGYEVSNNYPNPFNPKTRIGITLPNSGSVRVVVYNLLGQRVRDEIEKYFNAGDSYIDLELNGLPNGFYLARITLDEKYIVTKKLMLMYGSQHLTSSSGDLFSRLNKTTMDGNSILDTRIDSLVVTGSSISKKVFTNLQSMTGNFLNLGNLIITLPVPNAPTLSSPTDGSTEISLSPTLYWNVSNTATSYTLQVSTSSSFNSFVYNQSGLTNTNQQISGLSNFTKYYWHVYATNNNIPSNWSNTWSFNTIGTIPQAPTLTSPANNSTSISTSPTFTWNASIGATSYTLQVSTSSSFSTFVYNQSGLNSLSQQVTGLINSTQYYWRVNATNSYGTSSWSSTWSFTTLITVPQVPSLSSPLDGSGQISISPTLYWNVSAGATSYTLQVSTINDFSTLIYNQSGLINTNQPISGLSIFTIYYWRVNATNSYGTSSWLNYWTFTTLTLPCPGTPTVTYEGKTYNTVMIGTQCWLKENLDVGTMINTRTGGANNDGKQTNNNKIEKYCLFNEPNSCNIYGGLYLWSEALAYSTTPGAKGICPEGWHIPTLTEFQTLGTTVSNNSNMLKTVGQGWEGGIGTNTSGFSALFTGFVYNDGSFGHSSDVAYFWNSSVDSDPTFFNCLGLHANNSVFNLLHFPIDDATSVRCLKD